MSRYKDSFLPYRTLVESFLERRPPIAGYVKIGGHRRKPDGKYDVRIARNGRAWVPPVAWTDPARFEITTDEEETLEARSRDGRDTQKVDVGYKRDEAFHERVGEAPTRLRVTLPLPKAEDNLVSFLGCFDGREYVCKGNGKVADDLERGKGIACPCPRLKSTRAPQTWNEYGGPQAVEKRGLKCGVRSELTVCLDDASGFGSLYVFKTGGFYSTSGLLNNLEGFEQMFGTLAGLQGWLVVSTKSVRYSDGGERKKGKQPVVRFEVRGGIEEAQERARLAAGWFGDHPQIGRAFAEGVRARLEADLRSTEKSVGLEFSPRGATPAMIGRGADAPEAQGEDTLEGLTERLNTLIDECWDRGLFVEEEGEEYSLLHHDGTEGRATVAELRKAVAELEDRTGGDHE